MPTTHARLSPSSSARWISCPVSVRLSESVPEGPESSYAREGTLAHELGEIRAAVELGHISDAEAAERLGEWERTMTAEGYSPEDMDEMHGYITGYVQFVLDQRAEMGADSTAVFLEERVDTGIPECWGTSDAVLVSPTEIRIIDLKYGAGVPVHADGNTQLRLYGVGAYRGFGNIIGDTEHVSMSVYQPRIGDGHHSTARLTIPELELWVAEVAMPAARKALYESYAPFGPSEDACRWCPLAGVCKEHMRWATVRDFGDLAGEDDPADPTDVTTLSPEEMSRTYSRLDKVKQWAKDLEAAALDMAYSQGRKIPGYKVVRSGGRRVVTDPTAAIQRFIDHGYKPEQVAEFKLKSFSALDKALGKGVVDELAGDMITKSPGRESLVRESDPRPEISPTQSAWDDFSA